MMTMMIWTSVGQEKVRAGSHVLLSAYVGGRESVLLTGRAGCAWGKFWCPCRAWCLKNLEGEGGNISGRLGLSGHCKQGKGRRDTLASKPL